MVGAVLGIRRTEMKNHFPKWCRDFLYGVQILNDVNKQSWGFTFRYTSEYWRKSPGQMEFIRNPKYRVLFALLNQESENYFDDFANYCKNGESHYEPVLGLHNCPAEITFIKEGEVSMIDNAEFETLGFVTNQHTLSDNAQIPMRLGFDNIPVHQNDDFWNNEFQSVIYPSAGNKISVVGKHFEFNDNSKWCLI
ncbi:hypothetical protein SAMN05443429_10412 [Cruoricaptor ignavus]|uniref:Uncharacterized protein n=2 Tax=Cruoricaptor ignavus TaxID=1118202 RepID=A0A1M6DLD1_9FLAO|nr:hypothetical protein SAMN05443429_10412 [Cruoricaptor ignavus]